MSSDRRKPLPPEAILKRAKQQIALQETVEGLAAKGVSLRIALEGLAYSQCSMAGIDGCSARSMS